MWATLLRLSVRSTPFSLTVVGAIVLIGIYGITQIQIDAVPDITNNQVQVFAYAPGYSAAEVELLVTRPIESALATVPHRIEWRSISRMGLSLITLVFAEGVSPYESRSMIAERLLSIQDQLPAGVRPEIGPMSTGLSEAYQYILRPAVPVPLTDLRFIQDWIVRRALLETPGVADVSSFGGYVRRWDILLWPEALMRYRLSLSEVERALRNSNQLIGGGYLERGPSTFSLRAEGTWKKPSDILSAVVAERHGRPIRLSDIGEVREGHLPRYGALVEDTVGEAVGGIVLIRKGENTAKVIQHLQERIAALETRLPHGIRIEPFLNRERLIHRIVRTVVTNLSEAALIVIALLTCILGSWRAGLLVGSVIPLSMCFALGLMSLTGISANLMSLGAIDFGLIVDGTVILVEAVIVRLPHFSDRLQAAEEGSIHIREASLFGELVVLSVYLPLLLLSGVEGRMFRPMVITMMFALSAALLLSLTFVPWASGRFLRSPAASFSERLTSLLLRGGRGVFRWTVRHKFLPGIVWFALVGTGITLFFVSETRFLPELDEGALAVETRLPLGSSLPQTIRYAEEVHRLVLRQFPHVFSGAVAKIGTSEIPMDPMFVESADLILTLNESPPISRLELSDSLKKLLSSRFPGIFFGIQQPIQMRFNELLAGARTDILIRIIGPDLDTLRYWGEKAAQICREVPGVADLAQPLFFGNQQLILRWKPEALAYYGVDPEEAQKWLQAYEIGIPLSPVFFDQGKRTNVALRLAPEKRPSDPSQMAIPTTKGTWIPLSHVASLEYAPGYNEIPHAESERTYAIGINVRGRGAVSVVQEIKSRLDSLALPVGYRITYGGQWENYRTAVERLLWILPITICLLIALMYATLPHPEAILSILGVSLAAPAGGMVALSLRGLPFSISAAIGLISVFGLATLNGTVLLNRFYTLQRYHKSKLRCLRYALDERIRPIVATTLIAVAGLLPMAFSEQAGAEVQRPFATTVIGGLLCGASFNLWLLPLLYSPPSKKSKV